jgi:hypothetical protein
MVTISGGNIPVANYPAVGASATFYGVSSRLWVLSPSFQ